MKLRYEFETIAMGDEISAVPVGEAAENFHAVLQLNDVGAQMLQCIAESETPEEAHQKLCAAYPQDDRDDIGRKLCDFLNQLVREGILIP